jgi:hypothetical protein
VAGGFESEGVSEMTEQKYREIQSVIEFTACLLSEVDLRGFLVVIDDAGFFGTNQDYQTWRIREAADALLTFQKVCREYGL